MSIEFVTIGTCKVEVQYLRGRNGGEDGFWITTVCHEKEMNLTSWCGCASIPTEDRDIASNVMCYSDAEHEGVSRIDAKVRKVGGDADSALFYVTANVVRRADLVTPAA